MIREPIYDSVEDARLGKVSKSVKARVGKVAKPTTYSTKVKLSAAELAKAENDAIATLKSMIERLKNKPE